MDGGDEIILNLLPPKSSPARALEVVIVGGIGKALFHQLLAPFAVSPRGAAVRLSACDIEGLLLCMSFERASELRLGALRAQKTGGAASTARFILHSVAHRMEPPRF